jgi:hypothetical protein
VRSPAQRKPGFRQCELVIKAGIVDLTGDNRAMIYGALLWMADKLQSDQGEHARSPWTAKGKQAFKDT